MKKGNTALAILRIIMGWYMLWPFIDKLWGISGGAEKAWLNGASPTTGFLANSPSGPFADIFSSMAGSPLIDFLFMLGLVLIGLSLIFGIGVKVAGYSGALMMLLLWSSVLPPEHNPIIDEHFMNMFVFIYLAINNEIGSHIGLGKWWAKSGFVKQYAWLR